MQGAVVSFILEKLQNHKKLLGAIVFLMPTARMQNFEDTKNVRVEIILYQLLFVNGVKAELCCT